MSKIELLDFYTSNCGACKMLDATLSQITIPTTVELRKIDAEEYPELAGEYQVFGVPTLILIKDGEIINRHQGFLPAPTLQNWFNGIE